MRPRHELKLIAGLIIATLIGAALTVMSMIETLRSL